MITTPRERGVALIAASLLLSVPTRGAPTAKPDAGGASAPTTDPDLARTITVPAGRITTLTLRPILGHPVERAAPPSTSYAEAVARDQAGEFRQAANLYHLAVHDWDPSHGGDPVAIEAARTKAQYERQRSLLLDSLSNPAARSRNRSFSLALQRAQLLRLKLMTVRAFTGLVDRNLLTGARDDFREALRLATDRRTAPTAQIYLMLGATLAIAGQTQEARLAFAHVTEAQRASSSLALPMATYQAAIGNRDAALERLEVATRGGDRATLRDIASWNDWDRLRGDPAYRKRFARLFRR